MLKGEKVVLRPVRRSDIEYFLKWFNDPEVTQYLGMYLPMTEMAEEKFIEDLGSAPVATRAMFVIETVEDTDKKPIGSTGLSDIHPKNHNAIFGIAIGEKDYWSKGYGTEAASLIVRYGFEQLNLHRINSFAISFNERSLRLHLGVGFKEEGRQRKAIFKNGDYHDHVMFGLLREEWQANEKVKNQVMRKV
jgi:RimJ/RimL family protein N-acetyltransferase